MATMIRVYPSSGPQPRPSTSSLSLNRSMASASASNASSTLITTADKTVTLDLDEEPTSYKEYRGEGHPLPDLGLPGDMYIDISPHKRLLARTYGLGYQEQHTNLQSRIRTTQPECSFVAPVTYLGGNRWESQRPSEGCGSRFRNPRDTLCLHML